MRCIECGEDTKVLTTYQNKDGRVRRRRECVDCKTRFTTHEHPVVAGIEIATREELELSERSRARNNRSED